MPLTAKTRQAPQPQPAEKPTQPAPTAAPAAPAPPATVPESPSLYWGDVLTFNVWLACAFLLALLVLADVVVALFRLVF